uniref:Uncharacterized protein n=1 Tax=Cyclopterus lumpus TaxID=8103 RepID=A0A8C2WPR6_CYCLU
MSSSMIEAIQGVDKIIGQLMNGLKQIGLHRCLNIIILISAAGMEDTSCDRKEVLQELVGNVQNYWVSEGTFGRIRHSIVDVIYDYIYHNVSGALQCKKPDQKVKAYLKADLPKRLHFANSRRIEDVNVLVEPKWLFERYACRPPFFPQHGRRLVFLPLLLQAMFVSYGPGFQYKTEIEPFSNIELYNLMCDVMQISPADNNGTHGSMNHLLRWPFYTPAPPAERSDPVQCPLVSLDPEDPLGCSCPVGIVICKPVCVLTLI